jgi:hypothetical protein
MIKKSEKSKLGDVPVVHPVANPAHIVRVGQTLLGLGFFFFFSLIFYIRYMGWAKS